MLLMLCIFHNLLLLYSVSSLDLEIIEVAETSRNLFLLFFFRIVVIMRGRRVCIM